MRNTDNLKSTLFGTALWNCRRRPPAALRACWPFTSVTDVLDRSRWNATLDFTPDAQVECGDESGCSDLALISLPVNAKFLFKLNLEDPWSIEFRARINHGADRGSFSTFQIGDLSFSLGYRGYSTYDEAGYVVFSGADVSGISGTIAMRTQEHPFALTHANGCIRAYLDGALCASATVSLSGTAEYLELTRDSIWNFGNFRAVQKRLGTDSAYPVTDSFFTGYETL